MLKLLTGKCLLSEKVRTERIKLQLLLEKLVTGEWVGLIWLRIGHNDITVRDFGLKWFRIGYSDVFCPRFIPIGHNNMFSVRDFAITWLWIGHSDVFSVRDLFQSDTMKCFLSEILELHDSESDSDVFSVRDLFQSDTVTCFLSETYSNRTQWNAFCPKFWNYMIQNRTQWRVFCPRFIPIGHSDMFSVRDLFQSDTMTCFLSEILDFHDPESDIVTCFLSEILFQSDTVTCFLSEILDLHDSESDTVTCYMSENLDIRILSPWSTWL